VDVEQASDRTKNLKYLGNNFTTSFASGEKQRVHSQQKKSDNQKIKMSRQPKQKKCQTTKKKNVGQSKI
jgi:hypothetical protein